MTMQKKVNHIITYYSLHAEIIFGVYWAKIC